MKKNIAVFLDAPGQDSQFPPLRVGTADMPELESDSVLVKMLLRPVNPSGSPLYQACKQFLDSQDPEDVDCDLSHCCRCFELLRRLPWLQSRESVSRHTWLGRQVPQSTG